MKIRIIIDDKVFSDVEVADALVQDVASGKTNEDKSTLLMHFVRGNIEACLNLLDTRPQSLGMLEAKP